MSSFDRRRLTAGIAAGLAWPCAARAATPADAARELPMVAAVTPERAPGQTLETAVDVARRMTAPVRINGQGPFYFVVDTGANRSVISLELAAQLGLQSGVSSPLHGVAGVDMAQTVVASTFQVAGRSEEQVVMPALPQAAIGAAGIIGVDRLRNQRIKLDFRAHQLTVERSHFEPPPLFTTAVKARQRSGQLTIVDADLAGIPVSAFLDSGAERTIGNPALYELAVLKVPQSHFYEVPIVSVTGRTIPGQMAQISVLRLGNMRMTNIVVTFADLHVFQIWDLKRPAVLVGMDALRAFDSVTLDFGRSEVWFEYRG